LDRCTSDLLRLRNHTQDVSLGKNPSSISSFSASGGPSVYNDSSGVQNRRDLSDTLDSYIGPEVREFDNQ
jgi:hypothetical protein